MPIPIISEIASFLTGLMSGVIIMAVKKIQESRKKKKEDIYSPLYDEFAEISEEGLSIPNRTRNGIYSSEWHNFEPSERIQIDEELRSDLLDYYERIDDLEGLIEAVDKELSTRVKQTELLRKFDNQYQFLPIIRNRTEGIRPDKIIRTYDWLTRYGDILIKAESAEDLYIRIKEFDKTSNVGPKSSQFWSKRHYELIWDTYEDAEEQWLETNQYSSTGELVDEIESQAEDIKNKLGDKLDRFLLDPRF